MRLKGKMHPTGQLTLEFVNTASENVEEQVDVLLRHTISKFRHEMAGLSTREPLEISGLEVNGQGVYRLSIFPRRHRPVSQLVQVAEGSNRLRVILMVDPEKVTAVRFPSYEQLDPKLSRVLETSSQVEGRVGIHGRELYCALDDISRAGLLNFHCKTANTRFRNQRSVFDCVHSFFRVEGERIFANVSEELRVEAVNSIAYRLFHEISAAMYKPVQGMKLISTYKTYDPFGALHLTFLRNHSAELVAEIHIDEAQGIQHLGALVGHSRHGTHPYDIHQTLMRYQQLDPGYKLEVAE